MLLSFGETDILEDALQDFKSMLDDESGASAMPDNAPAAVVEQPPRA